MAGEVDTYLRFGLDVAKPLRSDEPNAKQPRDAGWRGIWLNREGEAPEDGAPADAEVEALSHLPLVLRSIDVSGDIADSSL